MEEGRDQYRDSAMGLQDIVIRGGAFNEIKQFSCVDRIRADSTGSKAVGFRCVSSVD